MELNFLKFVACDELTSDAYRNENVDKLGMGDIYMAFYGDVWNGRFRPQGLPYK